MTEILSADYVIIGCGAVGMAFMDVILSDSDATIVIIDSNAKPGGHWNYAYPFVRLHQPSKAYGVSSRALGQGRIEKGGLNDGLGELATGAEVLAYYDNLMRHDYLPTGRVQYFPMCNYTGDGKFVSRLTGKEYQAVASKKTVDATFFTASVPATHTPNFHVVSDVQFIPLGELPRVTEKPDSFVVVGGGKTGLDACLWLLESGVDPDDIMWIISRDGWYLDRKNTQFSESFFDDTMGSFANQFQSIAESTSIQDMFMRLESCGYFMRIFPDVEPTMFHGGTITRAEIAQLQKIKNVVRHGHVKMITRHEIIFDGISLPTTPNTLHIDCSASPVQAKPSVPVFADGIITPQMVRPYQPVFSAALTAYVALSYTDEAEMNRLTQPVCIPDKATDFISFTLTALVNQKAWGKEQGLREWIAGNRLDGVAELVGDINDTDTSKIEILARIKEYAPKAGMKLFEYLGELEAS